MSSGASPSGGDSSSAGTSTDTPTDIPAATSGTRLKAQFLSTPDGTAQFVGFYDSARNEECQLQMMPDDHVWCVPTSLRSDTYYIINGRPRDNWGPYTDAGCTKQIYVEPRSSCPSASHSEYWIARTERITRGAIDTGCQGPEWEIRKVGDPIETQFDQLFYRDPDGKCNASNFVPEGDLFELSEPISHDAFASAREQNRDMPSRLVVREWVTEDGAHQALGWYDTLRKEPCAFTLSEDDTTRCVPAADGYGDYYADAACTDPVVDIGGRANCKAPPLRYAGQTAVSEDCYLKVHLFEIGDVIPSGINVLFGSGQCTPSWTTSSSDHPFARLGAEIPARSFELLSTVWVGAGRLRQERYQNPEGFTLQANLQVPIGLWGAPPRYDDTEREELCLFQTTEDGISRCLPISFTMDDWKSNETPQPPTGFSLDPSCTAMDLSFLRRHYCAPLSGSVPQDHYSDVPRAIVTTVQADSCTSFPALWSISEQHQTQTDSIYWHGNPPGPQCTEITGSSLDYFGVVGERIPRTAFQAAVVITEQ